jgi:hypothetical protein
MLFILISPKFVKKDRAKGISRNNIFRKENQFKIIKK